MNLVGVSLDEDKAEVDRFVADKEIFWPEICDGKADEGEVAKLYNVQGTPDLWVIDRAGKIAARLHSAKMLDEELDKVASRTP